MTNRLRTNDIRQLLGQSAAQLPPDTLDKLREARRAAMAHHDPEAQGRWEWANNWRHSPAAWVATVLLTLSLVGGGLYYWQAHDNSDVDLAILTDDLPANVFVN